MVFHRNLSDSKSSQDSKTLLSILAYLNNAVVKMVSTCLLIANSSSPCTSLLGTVPSVATTIGITVTFMFQNFFGSLARSRYLSLFSLSFSFTLWSARTAKSTIRKFWGFFCLFVFFFCFFLFFFCLFFIITRSGRLLLFLLFHSLWVFHVS